MFTYTFKDGSPTVHVKGIKDATAFVNSYGDLIEGTQKFSVRARWMSYRAKLTIVVNPTVAFVPPNANLPNADDNANVNRIIKKLSVMQPLIVSKVGT